MGTKPNTLYASVKCDDTKRSWRVDFPPPDTRPRQTSIAALSPRQRRKAVKAARRASKQQPVAG